VGLTLFCACLSGVFTFMFVRFVQHTLPLKSFEIRDPAGAQYTVLGLACGALLLVILAWRGAIKVQPAAVHTRRLMSAPDAKGERSPLLELTDEEGPPPQGWRPTQEAAARAAARAARLAAAHAAFSAAAVDGQRGRGSGRSRGASYRVYVM